MGRYVIVNRDLLQQVTKDEVKRAAFQLGGKNALGLDGFSSLFYHSY